MEKGKVIVRELAMKFFCSSYCCESVLIISSAKIMQAHEKEKMHNCAHCDKSFASASRLMIHRRLHSGERPFRCGPCSKHFKSSGNLKRHQLIHTGAKPFKCGQCNKSFTQPQPLKSHQLIHTGAKKYKCFFLYLLLPLRGT